MVAGSSPARPTSHIARSPIGVAARVGSQIANARDPDARTFPFRQLRAAKWLAAEFANFFADRPGAYIVSGGAARCLTDAFAQRTMMGP
ncbi:hypothetical protein VARIO8X_120134 [Burkholderiales bacterium 8X]|nr:hypothetical protein VARIO8X_120134 [Burkholderiales bacterium 8X]